MAKNKNDDVDVPLSLRVSRRRLITGDLEDDPQDTLLQDINSNLRRSNNKLDSLENQVSITFAILYVESKLLQIITMLLGW